MDVQISVLETVHSHIVTDTSSYYCLIDFGLHHGGHQNH